MGSRSLPYNRLGCEDQGGKMSQLSDALVGKEGVSIDLLLLDPQNPRFETPVAVDEAAFDSLDIQEATKTMLGQPRFGVNDLAQSIRQIGFLPVDRVVVLEFDATSTVATTGTQKYIVIEGNRRVAAIKLILAERRHRPISTELEESISTLDVLVLKPEICGMTPGNARDVIQGVRHISGVSGWGTYQQAVALRGVMNSSASTHRLTQSQAAAAVGLSVLETNADLNALGVYEQMVADEEYGPRAVPSIFSYFVEAVRKPAIREWLQFSDQDKAFHSEDRRKLFYSWITPDDNSFQKIREALEVRKLVKIIPHSAALAALSNDDQIGIDAALVMVSAPATPPAVDWEATLQSIVDQLERFPASRLSNEADITLLQRIDQMISGLLPRQ